MNGRIRTLFLVGTPQRGVRAASSGATNIVGHCTARVPPGIRVTAQRAVPAITKIGNRVQMCHQ